MLESDSSTVGTFERFSDLPPEIRHEVWRFAALESSNTEASSVCIYEASLDPKTRQPIRPLLVVRQVPLALRGTTNESRAVVGEVQRAFRPAEDVLYVRAENWYSFTSWGIKYHGGSEPWAAELRHLAIPLPVANTGLCLPYALKSLPNLETVSIVFPRAIGGEMDIHEDTLLSESQKTRFLLRTLTSEESENLVLRADYDEEDLIRGWSRVQYMTNAKKHVSKCFEDCDSRTKGNLPKSYFDLRTGKLRLKYEAACFISS